MWRTCHLKLQTTPYVKQKSALGLKSSLKASSQNFKTFIKGELQRQNKLISSERPIKILQSETKIIKIGQAALEIFNFKDRDLDNFMRKKDSETENVVFRRFAQTEEQ